MQAISGVGASQRSDRAAASPDGYSLLRASLLQRIGIASAALALLWAGVFWALA